MDSRSNSSGGGPGHEQHDRDEDATKPTGSDVDPAVVQPGSKADPSTTPEWDEHVEGYFNQDVTPGEALPMATDEAKE